jgi:hypothetical protein
MQLAQLNIAQAKYPLDAAQMKEFVDNLAPINAIAEASEGFVWRLVGDNDNATNIQAFSDPNIIVNMSIWTSIDSLKNFMFKTHHRDFLKNKKVWFSDMKQENYVLWWLEDGEIPSVDDAIIRLEHLRSYGDSPYAFSFKVPFNAS